MEKIVSDFKYFIQLCSENLWSLGDGLEDNFKLYVDTADNQLDSFLNSDYQGTPLWFYFLSFDYSFFDYFKERISLKTDWDYTLLFNVDYIESSSHFISLSPSIYHNTLTPFCPLDVLIPVFKKEQSSHLSCSFTLPSLSLDKFSTPLYSDFLKNAKIKFQLSSFSHIMDHDSEVGLHIFHSIMHCDILKNSFLSQLSLSRTEDFFNIKVNLLFHYPSYCQHSFVDRIDSQQLSTFVTDIISHKKNVDKKTLFHIMNKEHLVLALHSEYFTLPELSQFITDKTIHYHILSHKLSQSHTTAPLPFKKHKI